MIRKRHRERGPAPVNRQSRKTTKEGGRALRFFSLRDKLILASVLFILIPIATTGIYAYRSYEQTLSRQIESAASDRLVQVNRNIEREIRQMVNAANSIILDDGVKDILVRPPATMRERLDYVHWMDKKFLEISTAIITEDVYLTVLDHEGNMYTNWSQRPDSYEEIRGAEWFRSALQRNGYVVWEMHQASYAHRRPVPMVTLAMAIRDRNLSSQIGVLVISEPQTQFRDILKAEDQWGSTGLILGQNGDMIGGEGRSIPDIRALLQGMPDHGAGTVVADGEKVKLFTDTISLTDWKAVQMVPEKEIFKRVTNARLLFIVTLAASMTLFIALIIAISSMITGSLRKLGLAMKQVESGQLDVAFPVRSRDEVGLLSKSFNHMVKRLRHHLENEIVLERSKEKAKLEALQAQINPHFLHNTINSIKWMSIMAGTKPITDMLLSLGHLLDMSIHRGQEAVTLEEELKNVEAFLTIQKFRFGDTIAIEEDIAPETLPAYVPKLSLQPLVENVYRHGLFIDGGRMRIRTRLADGILTMEVVDNGGAVTAEQIRSVQEQIRRNRPEGFSGIGLANVHNRIRMMYGSGYGLTLHRDERAGETAVRIALPFRTEWSEEEAS